MNVTIPEGWQEIRLGNPVYYYDLQWNRETRMWEPVTHYGDYQKHCKKRYTIREINPRKQLMMMLRYFPVVPYIYSRYNAYNLPLHIAHILWLAGAKTIKNSVGYSTGKKEIENLMVHDSSIAITPYLSLPSTNGINLFWFLLKKLEVKYMGGASNDKVNGYIQACLIDKPELIGKIVCNFNAIKSEFGT